MDRGNDCVVAGSCVARSWQGWLRCEEGAERSWYRVKVG